MLAVRVEEFGVDKLTVRELPDPRPGIGEVLVFTEAATINPADARVVTGAAVNRFPTGAIGPYVPGWDLVGRIAACGDGVNDSLIGSRVIGFSPWLDTLRGTQASLVTLPIGHIVMAPRSPLAVELTTIGLNGLTAWRGLADLRLRNGEIVAVTGATGGVGGFAVEIAVSRGFTVIGIVREGQKEEARALGVTTAISADEPDLGDRVREIVPAGVDALLDTASIGEPALAAVRDSGKYVTVTDLPVPERGIDVSPSGARMDREALTKLTDMADRGLLHTPVANVFNLNDAARAYEAFAGRVGRGRIVLSFNDDVSR